MNDKTDTAIAVFITLTAIIFFILVTYEQLNNISNQYEEINYNVNILKKYVCPQEPMYHLHERNLSERKVQ